MDTINQMGGRVRVGLLLTTLLLGACSKGEPEAPPRQTPPAPDADNVIGKPLNEALRKAEQVEQTIQNGVDRREQAMRDQGL